MANSTGMKGWRANGDNEEKKSEKDVMMKDLVGPARTLVDLRLQETTVQALLIWISVC